MKNSIILFMLFILSFTSFGQKFEVSEMIGYSKEATNIMGGGSGRVNQIGANYYFTKHFSLGANYELNFWNTQNHSFGIIPRFHFGRLYFGAGISELVSNSYLVGHTHMGYELRDSYSNSVLFSAHIGISQKIVKHLFVNGQIAGYYSSVNTQTYNFQPPTKLNFEYYALMVGLSYKF